MISHSYNGPVKVQPVNECALCDQAVHDVPDPSHTGWKQTVHTDTGERACPDADSQPHPWKAYAQAKRRCMDCKGPITSRQDAYADYTECAACKTYTRYSIGD
ncbi:hypothetical protein [Streptomyces sp. cg36]|uniref:hypothetical protein n=1 Tax=Streptomyces sp. cg36 TaxID=3238798 RepID=UPI0034E1A51B